MAAKPEVVESIRALVRATRAEDGCIDYSFAQDLTDPDVLVLFERWRDADALAAHFGTPHMATFQQVMTEEAHLLTEDPKYRAYSEWMERHGLITAPLARLGNWIRQSRPALAMPAE